MKKLSKILAFLSLSTFFSCNNVENEEKIVFSKDTPTALKEKSSVRDNYFSGSSGSDLTEELYIELVSKNPKLKNLEEDMQLFYQNPYFRQKQFATYDSKSNDYYSSANDKAMGISDSVLRDKILALLTDSKTKYAKKTDEHQDLLKIIEQNRTSINDKHLILKIVLTLPIIEKYQNENLPNTQDSHDLIKKQTVLIQKLDSLLP